MIDHNEDTLEDALGIRDGFKEEVKNALFDYIKTSNESKGKKSHLIEHIKDALNVKGENEMFMLGSYLKEFEMMVDIKETVTNLMSSHLPTKVEFQKDEFIKYLNEDKDDF
jgi:hypothetical protein